jgi:hypothetical protein
MKTCYTSGLAATIQGLWRYPVFSSGYIILTLTTQKEGIGYQQLGESLIVSWELDTYREKRLPVTSLVIYGHSKTITIPKMGYKQTGPLLSYNVKRPISTSSRDIDLGDKRY